MLQNLETAQRNAELGARLQVFEGQREHRLHDADGFGADCGDGLVGHAFENGSTVLRASQHRFKVDPHIIEAHIGGARAVLQRIVAAAYAG